MAAVGEVQKTMGTCHFFLSRPDAKSPKRRIEATLAAGWRNRGPASARAFERSSVSPIRRVAVKSQAHAYKVRPGYGTNKLLIQFGPSPSDEQFIKDLVSVLKGSGVLPKSKENLVVLTIQHFDSPAGPFEIHDDGYFIFIHADTNQKAIHFLDRILQESGLFRKEQVNFDDYARNPKPRPPSK